MAPARLFRWHGLRRRFGLVEGHVGVVLDGRFIRARALVEDRARLVHRVGGGGADLAAIARAHWGGSVTPRELVRLGVDDHDRGGRARATSFDGSSDHERDPEMVDHLLHPLGGAHVDAELVGGRDRTIFGDELDDRTDLGEHGVPRGVCTPAFEPKDDHARKRALFLRHRRRRGRGGESADHHGEHRAKRRLLSHTLRRRVHDEARSVTLSRECGGSRRTLRPRWRRRRRVRAACPLSLQLRGRSSWLNCSIISGNHLA